MRRRALPGPRGWRPAPPARAGRRESTPAARAAARASSGNSSTVPGTFGCTDAPSTSSSAAHASSAGDEATCAYRATAGSRSPTTGASGSRSRSPAAPPYAPATVGRSCVVHGRHREPREMLRRARLEPGQPVGEDAVVGQRLANAGLDGAEVLADHHAARAAALERQHRQQVAGRVGDVGAGRGGRADRQHEQAEQAHHVVDPDAAGVRHVRLEVGREARVAVGRQRGGEERRQTPVLARRAERVGRRADRQPVGDHALPQPVVVATRRGADGEVGDDAEAHRRDGRELLVGQQLQPRVEGDLACLVARQPRHRGAGGIAQRVGPVRASRARVAAPAP